MAVTIMDCLLQHVRPQHYPTLFEGLIRLDTAYDLSRHITRPLVDALLGEVRKNLTVAGVDPPADFDHQSGVIQVSPALQLTSIFMRMSILQRRLFN